MRDVAAVAFGGDVLAEGLDGLTGDDAAADGGLDGDLEEVADQGPAAAVDPVGEAA